MGRGMTMSLKHHHEFMWAYSKSLLVRVFKRPAFIFLGLSAFSVMALFSVVIFFIEHDTNPKFEHWLDAAYFTVSTMTSVGFGDVVPLSQPGKIVAMVMMLLGTFIFVSFTGVVASTVLELELEIKSKHGRDA